MKKKWNLILIAVLLMLTSVFLTACKTVDGTEGQDTAINKEQTDSKEDVVSDEPIEYDTDYAEDDETMGEDSSEQILDGHEVETVIDESQNIEPIPEEDSEY